jgi:hypothetical protein
VIFYHHKNTLETLRIVIVVTQTIACGQIFGANLSLKDSECSGQNPVTTHIAYLCEQNDLVSEGVWRHPYSG